MNKNHDHGYSSAVLRFLSKRAARNKHIQEQVKIAKEAIHAEYVSSRTDTGESPPVVGSYLESSIQAWRHADKTEEGAEIIDAIAQIAPTLHWVVGYDEPDIDEEFRKNFAYTEVMLGRSVNSSVCFGITLIGPHTFYDWHNHPAVETYACLSAGSEWGLDHKPLRKQSIGSVILHPSNAPHAMRTNEHPLLAPWMWTGNIDVPARMT